MSKMLTIGITQGDSNGIGYEVIIKALADPRMMDMFIPVVYGSSKMFGFNKKLPLLRRLWRILKTAL